MGCDVYIFGRSSVNERHKKMEEVRTACESAGVDLPEEVEKYFEKMDFESTDDDGNLLIGIDDAVDGEVLCDRYVTVRLKDLPEEVDEIVLVTS